jgi:hypothetical protein
MSYYFRRSLLTVFSAIAPPVYLWLRVFVREVYYSHSLLFHHFLRQCLRLTHRKINKPYTQLSGTVNLTLYRASGRVALYCAHDWETRKCVIVPTSVVWSPYTISY